LSRAKCSSMEASPILVDLLVGAFVSEVAPLVVGVVRPWSAARERG
jgi:hypothetical protein